MFVQKGPSNCIFIHWFNTFLTVCLFLFLLKVLQAECKQKDQAISDFNRVLDNMREKMEGTDERISQLTLDVEQRDAALAAERERFEAEKQELVRSHQEMLSEVREVARQRRDQLEALQSEHRRELSQLVGKSNDAGTKALERRCQEAEEILSGKVRVLEMLQTEIGEKEKHLLEQGTTIKSLTEKLKTYQDQLQTLQGDIASREESWKNERAGLEGQIGEMREKHETELSEKQSAVTALQTGLQQYETAYNQAATQYSQVMENHNKIQSELEETRAELDQSRTELEQTRTIQLEQGKALIEEKEAEIERLQQQLKDKEEEVNVKAAEVEEMNTKAEAKLLKLKTQAKAKIKALEEDMEELKKVLHALIYSYP